MRTFRFSGEQSRCGVRQAEAPTGFGCLRRKYGMAQATFYPETLADHLSIALVLRQGGQIAG